MTDDRKAKEERFERIAVAAMQGLLAADVDCDPDYDYSDIAEWSVRQARALIAELDKERNHVLQGSRGSRMKDLIKAADALAETVEMARELFEYGLISFEKFGLTTDEDIGEKYSADLVAYREARSAYDDELARLRDALTECRDEIDEYIRREYPFDHPVYERYRQRDFALNPARIALEATK